MHLRNDSRLCGPSLLTVFSAVPPPAVVTMMCSPPSAVDRLLQDLLGALEVGDVHLVEGSADGVGDFLALRLRPVEDRHAGPTLWPAASAVDLPKPEAPPTMMAFLPAISIWLPFQKVLDS